VIFSVKRKLMITVKRYRATYCCKDDHQLSQWRTQNWGMSCIMTQASTAKLWRFSCRMSQLAAICWLLSDMTTMVGCSLVVLLVSWTCVTSLVRVFAAASAPVNPGQFIARHHRFVVWQNRRSWPTAFNKNSSRHEIANVKFYAVRPEATRIHWNNAK